MWGWEDENYERKVPNPAREETRQCNFMLCLFPPITLYSLKESKATAVIETEGFLAKDDNLMIRENCLNGIGRKRKQKCWTAEIWKDWKKHTIEW